MGWLWLESSAMMPDCNAQTLSSKHARTCQVINAQRN
jgi:hypothetical protein